MNYMSQPGIVAIFDFFWSQPLFPGASYISQFISFCGLYHWSISSPSDVDTLKYIDNI